MYNLFQPYSIIEVLPDIKPHIFFDRSYIKEGFEFFFWQMSEIKYFNDVVLAKNYYEINQTFILSIRIFNATEEYHFWRTNNTLKGRYRKDISIKENTDIYAIETEMVLRGVIAKQIPINGKLCIKTRNYIDNDGFGYNDSRFMEITSKT